MNNILQKCKYTMMNLPEKKRKEKLITLEIFINRYITAKRTENCRTSQRGNSCGN